MRCGRCGTGEAVDTFATGYDGDGNPIGEEALCELCIFSDWEEEVLEILSDIEEECYP